MLHLRSITVKKNKIKYLCVLFTFLFCSCEYEESISFDIQNGLEHPIKIEFSPLLNSTNSLGYKNRRLDTIINSNESLLIYQESGGIVCATCDAKDRRTEKWNIDSLLITVNDTIQFTKFNNSRFWDFTSDRANAYYRLFINENKIK